MLIQVIRWFPLEEVHLVDSLAVVICLAYQHCYGNCLVCKEYDNHVLLKSEPISVV